MARKKLDLDERIPKGSCCYTLNHGPQFDEDDVAHFKGDCCPFYIHKEGIEGTCVKFQQQILDAVKICNFEEEKF